MEETMTFQSQTAIVTGGSRGLGRGIVQALAAKKMRVVAIARDAERLASTAKDLGVESVVADVADSVASGRVLQDFNPDLLVLCAGALPLLRPLHLHSWETFSENWETDAKATFNWIRDALLLPMKSGSHIVVISSIAAVLGSPLSGSYAGAKRMQWLIAEYASQEAVRFNLSLRFHCLLPTLNANTDLGRATMAAYARRAGVSTEEFVKRFNPPLTPAIIGQAVVDLHESPSRWDKLAYRVSGDGLAPLDQPNEPTAAAANNPNTRKTVATD
jgi:NAD(P)-dependent dehydrogenase (short-subunit alcohol dehydrogenase family)